MIEFHLKYKVTCKLIARNSINIEKEIKIDKILNFFLIFKFISLNIENKFIIKT